MEFEEAVETECAKLPVEEANWQDVYRFGSVHSCCRGHLQLRCWHEPVDGRLRTLRGQHAETDGGNAGENGCGIASANGGHARWRHDVRTTPEHVDLF